MVSGIPATEAATLGTLPTVGIGLLMALVNELRVATEDVDEDRDDRFGWRIKGAGDGGRAGVGETLEDGVEVGLVGVTEGVGDTVGRGPVYFSPSSPGENTTTEQKPSVDVISNVLPSGDLSMVS